MDYRILGALVAIVFSFIFSASETALTSLSRLDIQRLSQKNKILKGLIDYWTSRSSRVLVTILIGNNISSITASSLITLWAREHYSLRFSLVLGIFTFIFIFISEILPKMIARQKASQMSPFFIRFLKIVSILLWPIIVVVEVMSRGLVRFMGFSSFGFRKPFSEEELEQSIELATKEGSLDQETGTALTNLMDFPDRIARDVMTPRSKIEFLKMAGTQEDVFKHVFSEGYSRIPVCREGLDDIVGVLHVKDLFANFYSPLGKKRHWTRYIRRPYFVSEMAPLGGILRDMKRWGTHLALVRNEGGVIIGLLSLEDLIEEIVGEIRDEHDDPSEAGFEAAMGAPKIVSGEMQILDFNELYDQELSFDVSYSTLNGYVLYKCGGKLPVVGTLIVDDNVTFRVHGISENGIASFELIEQDRSSDE